MEIDKNDASIALRCQNAIDCGTRGLISPSELIEGLQMPDPHFRYLAEDVGLGRIFRGYENVEHDEWVCPFTP